MILLPELYKDKRICLLGSGMSLSTNNRKYTDYDLVVGINRLYHTEYLDVLNVLYYNLSSVDQNNLDYMLETMNNKKNIKYLIFCPWCNKAIQKTRKKIAQLKFNKEYVFCQKIVRQVRIKQRPLTGIAALNHIVLSGAKSVNVYGFDFYQKEYVCNMKHYKFHDTFHNIEDNIRFLNEMMQKHNIIWHK